MFSDEIYMTLLWIVIFYGTKNIANSPPPKICFIGNLEIPKLHLLTFLNDVSYGPHQDLIRVLWVRQKGGLPPQKGPFLGNSYENPPKMTKIPPPNCANQGGTLGMHENGQNPP